MVLPGPLAVVLVLALLVLDPLAAPPVPVEVELLDAEELVPPVPVAVFPLDPQLMVEPCSARSDAARENSARLPMSLGTARGPVAG